MNRPSRKPRARICVLITPIRRRSGKPPGPTKLRRRPRQALPKPRLPSHIHHPGQLQAGVGGVRGSRAMRHRERFMILRAPVIIEVEPKVDAKVCQRLKAAVSGTIRRNLKHDRAINSNTIRLGRLRGESRRSAMTGTVPKKNGRHHLRQVDTMYGLLGSLFRRTVALHSTNPFCR